MLNEEKSASGGEGQSTESQILQSVNPQTIPPQHNSSNFRSKLPWMLVIILLVLAGILGGYFILNQTKNNSQTPTPEPDQKACSQEAKLCPDGSSVGRTGLNCEFAECPATSASPSANADTSTWKTYSDNDFALSFKYPSALGDVILKPGPEGKLIGFSKNDGLILGAYIKPSSGSNDRGGTVLDFSGYAENKGKYYFNDWLDTSSEEIIPIKVIQADGNKILILNNDSFTKSKDAYEGYGLIGKNSTIALINLDTDKYSGIVFDNGADDKQPISQEEFLQILSTFKFTQ